MTTDEDNFEQLSYQNNSIEIIGNNWETAGDESTIEILEDFNTPSQQTEYTAEKPKEPKTRDVPIQQTQKKIIKLGMSQDAQNFLSKVKTNTIKLF